MERLVRNSFSKEDVINAIERKGTNKIPLVFHKWWGEGLTEKYGHNLDEIDIKYPDDIFVSFYTAPGTIKSTIDNSSYRWGYMEDYSNAERHSIAEDTVLLPNWKDIDKFLSDLPDPNQPEVFDGVKKQLNPKDNRYKLGAFWRLFHEKLWTIRGMENLMMDYYDHMDELKIIGKQLLNHYKVVIDRYHALGFDGIFSSDDLGHQTGPMMSPKVFKELYFPLYEELIDYIHQKDMHMFLHSCGDNSLLIPYLIDAKLDVFHPIQKGCMDYIETVEQYGDQLSFLAGFDVQNMIINGTTQDIKKEVNRMVEIFYRKEGGLLLAMGNGIMPDAPLENIDAVLYEMSLCSK